MTDAPTPRPSASSSTDRKRQASTCRFATPTLFLPAPYWLDAEAAPWTCIRGAVPHLLLTTDPCESCPHWEPAGRAAEDPDAPDRDAGAPGDDTVSVRR